MAGDGASDQAAYQRSNRIIEDGINRRVGAGCATVDGVSKLRRGFIVQA